MQNWVQQYICLLYNIIGICKIEILYKIKHKRYSIADIDQKDV